MKVHSDIIEVHKECVCSLSEQKWE